MNSLISNRIKKCAALLYLFVSYIYIVYYFSYYIRVMAKPVGLMILIIKTLGLYGVFILINHLLLNKVVVKKCWFSLKYFCLPL